MPNQVLYGFTDIRDLNSLVSEVGVPVVDTAITRAVEAHNREVDLMLSLFSVATTDFKTVYRFPGTARLQPMDNDGRARKIRHGDRYDVALPLFMGAVAWGANYVTRVKMTVQDANDETALLTLADMNWTRDQMLSALFNPTPYTFDDDEHGPLTIRGLANGDATLYPRNGTVSAATDNHLMAQVADIADATNPFPAIKTNLTHHSDNRGEVIHFIASDLVADAMNLGTFVDRPDANVYVDGGTRIVGNFPLQAYPGAVLGYVQGGGWLVEWPSLPDSYIVSITSAGQKPLAMRQEAIAALQGFRKQGEREDHPFWEAHFARIAGFGGWNRTGAVVTLIGSATYAAPSGLTAPLV